MPWSVLGTIGMYEDEGEMRGDVRTLWCVMLYSWEYALIQVYVHGMCNILCGIIHIIPFHGIPGIETVYMCMRDVQQREICERIVTLLQQ
jgi:hypothetical protein